MSPVPKVLPGYDIGLWGIMRGILLAKQGKQQTVKIGISMQTLDTLNMLDLLVNISAYESVWNLNYLSIHFNSTPTYDISCYLFHFCNSHYFNYKNTSLIPTNKKRHSELSAQNKSKQPYTWSSTNLKQLLCCLSQKQHGIFSQEKTFVKEKWSNQECSG